MAREHSFFAFTAHRPVAIFMMVAAAVVFGVVGYLRLPVNLLPEITHPILTIRTEFPGASPQDVEERISERIQEQVSVINGVRRVVSISRPGVSDVLLTFAWGTKMVFAVSDIRERLDRVYLPGGAERPLVLRYDPSLDPVMTLGLTSDTDLVELRRIADEELELELSELDGVAAVKVRGGEEEEIHIAVDEQKLTLYGIDIQLIGQRLAAENLNSAAGVVEEGKTEYLVRALNEFKSLEEIENVIIVRRGDVSIRLEDVAVVTRIPKDREVISRIDGRQCVLLDIYKEAGANIVQLCDDLTDRIFGTEEQQKFVEEGKHQEPLEEDAPEETKPKDKEARKQERMKLFRELAKRRRMTNFIMHRMQPLGVDVTMLQDQSRFVSDSIDDVKGSAINGGLFAILVIYLFLRRFRATAILFVSIPVSLVATFAPMFMSGIDMNIMSLGGLALGVGMLVDNSIVVLEAITRASEQGLGRKEAAVEGVSRVAGAVIASTLTTVAVFFPIVFVEGVAGQLFRDQALTVVFALLISLLVALFVIPMLASRGRDGTPPPNLGRLWRHFRLGLPGLLAMSVVSWVAQGMGDDQEELKMGIQSISSLIFLVLPFLAPPPPKTADTRIGGWLQRIVSFWLGTVLLVVCSGLALAHLVSLPFTYLFDAGYRLVARVYPAMLGGALRMRAVVLLIALTLLGLASWRAMDLGNELLPEVHQGEFFLDSFLPRDATVERTDQVMRLVEAEVGRLEEVETTFLASGIDKRELNDSDQGEHSSRILITLRPSDDRVAQELRIREAIRGIIRKQPDVLSFRFARPSVLAFNAPVVVELFGRDVLQLRKTSERIKAMMETVPGLRDVRSTLQRGNTEIAIRFDRDKMAALGLETRAVTTLLQNKVQGDVPTLFAERERKIDIMVRLDRKGLHTKTQLLAINVNPRGSPAMPLGSIATLHVKEGPSEIRRIGNRRGAEVHATLSGFDLGSSQDLLELELADLQLPKGVTAQIGGQKAEKEESLNSLTMALLLAVFLVYVVMASQFENMVQPFIILLTLPLALVGVVFVLELLSIPLSVVVFLGGIVLAGIVVNNAIILIDQINHLRSSGRDKLSAIVEGCKIRLRPVLMTTSTTVLGLLPLTGWLGGGEGLELRAPMAIVVVAGLSVSTLLTLIVIPVVYSLVDRKS